MIALIYFLQEQCLENICRRNVHPNSIRNPPSNILQNSAVLQSDF